MCTTPLTHIVTFLAVVEICKQEVSWSGIEAYFVGDYDGTTATRQQKLKKKSVEPNNGSEMMMGVSWHPRGKYKCNN